jgi:hypothetical protein
MEFECSIKFECHYSPSSCNMNGWCLNCYGVGRASVGRDWAGLVCCAVRTDQVQGSNLVGPGGPRGPDLGPRVHGPVRLSGVRGRRARRRRPSSRPWSAAAPAPASTPPRTTTRRRGARARSCVLSIAGSATEQWIASVSSQFSSPSARFQRDQFPSPVLDAPSAGGSIIQ